jgi:N-acetylglutamate synthase-like GNAT family acetyltransferase
VSNDLTPETNVGHVHRERIQVDIRSLIKEDIPILEDILKQHVRWAKTGEIDVEEVKRVMSYMNGEQDNYGRTRDYLVATHGEQKRVIGCVAISTPDPKMQEFCKVTISNARELLNFYVDNDYRKGKGVGTTLFQEACNAAYRQGAQVLVLNSGLRNHWSWSFYDKVCDLSHGIIWDYYSEGWHTKAWEKRL